MFSFSEEKQIGCEVACCVRVRVRVRVFYFATFEPAERLAKPLCAHYTFWDRPSAVLLDFS